MTNRPIESPASDGGVEVSPDFITEEILVAALRRRDSAAYEIFVRRFGGRMLIVARRYLRDEHDCTEAVQDAFVAAFQAMERFKGSSELATWLHRIVINTCLMKLRSRSRRHELSIEELLPTFDASGHDQHPARRWRILPDEELQRSENRSVVRRCIDMLPDEYREVVLLRDIEEYSTDDTAKMLEITPGAVKTRLHRARQGLRTLLEPHFAQ